MYTFGSNTDTGSNATDVKKSETSVWFKIFMAALAGWILGPIVAYMYFE